MSVRNLDLPSIVGRITGAGEQGAEPSISSGAASKIEIPDPVTLLELAAQAGVTLEWVLYGGGEQEPGGGRLRVRNATIRLPSIWSCSSRRWLSSANS